MKRQRFISAAELERNVQDFLDSLDNQPFHGNNFIDDEDDPTDAGTSVEAPRLRKTMTLYLLNPQKCTGLKIRRGNL